MQALGPLPRKIFLLKLNLLGDKSSSTGEAIARAMANQQSGWELEVNYEQLSDEDLIALLKIPHLTRLKCDGAFSARGLAAIPLARSLNTLEMHVSSMEDAELSKAVLQSDSLKNLRLRGVNLSIESVIALQLAKKWGWIDIEQQRQPPLNQPNNHQKKLFLEELRK